MVIFQMTQPHSPNWAAVLTGVWRGVPGRNASTWSHLWFQSTGTELKVCLTELDRAPVKRLVCVFPLMTPLPHQDTVACNQPCRGHSKHPLNLPESLVSYQLPSDPLRAFLRFFLASPFTQTLLWSCSDNGTQLTSIIWVSSFLSNLFTNWFAEFHTMTKYASTIPKQFEEFWVFLFFVFLLLLICYQRLLWP